MATKATKEEISTLKIKINELERQVNEYKSKLDELRRAKATTVIKLEKEYVNTTIPTTNRAEKSKICERCEEMEKTIENERKSNSQLKRLLEQKEKSTNGKSSSSSSSSCGKCSQLNDLLKIEKDQNTQLEQQILTEKKFNEEEKNAKIACQRALELIQFDLEQTKILSTKLQEENQQLKETFEAMKNEHSLKMAQLAQREEEAKKQVETWEQMYREWMATMERRVNNLQVTNEELQTWLNDENPNRPPANRNQRP